jgi:hypothetical protein
VGASVGPGGDGGQGGDAKGGGIAINAGTVGLTGATVSTNTAHTINGGTGGDGGDTPGAGQPGGNGGNGGAVLGGGLFIQVGTLTLQSTTIADNRANLAGGGFLGSGDPNGLEGAPFSPLGAGVHNDGASVTAVSTLFANTGDDFSGTVTATFSLFELLVGTVLDVGSANNVLGVFAMIGPLSGNGGPTETHAPLVGSPALDTGANPANLAVDQRGIGFFRHSGPGVDIGAVELQLPSGPQLLFDPASGLLVLSIEGRSSRDRVFIKNASGGQLRVDFNGKVTNFAAADVSRIIAFGRNGNDELRVDPHVNISATLDGGDGNDILKGGGAADVLLGQAGEDVLFGFDGRDILIGGVGRDHLHGLSGDDILVGGRTTYDNDHQALLDIQALWTSALSYAQRVADLVAGVGAPQLSATQIADAHKDFLHGNAALDLFFRELGDVTDRNGAEVSVTVP